MLPFTRGLLGPADITPGGFRNRPPKQWKLTVPTTVLGTRARQLALAALIDSPLLCLGDSYDSYRGGDGYKPGMAFFRSLPTVWDETRVLDSDIAGHVVEARRKGDARVPVAMNADKPLTLKVRMDFLGDGDYRAAVFADRPESETDAEAIVEEQRPVRRGDEWVLTLATGGGFAARIEPANR